jgi:hypothetical protein
VRRFRFIIRANVRFIVAFEIVISLWMRSPMEVLENIARNFYGDFTNIYRLRHDFPLLYIALFLPTVVTFRQRDRARTI